MVVATPSEGLGAGLLYEATENVLGQEAARRRLATILHRQAQIADGAAFSGTGALVGGATGVGKSYLVRTMCRACGLPFAEANATRYSEAGFVGMDLTQMYLPLVRAVAREYDREKRLDAIQAGERWEPPEKRASPLDRPLEEREEIGERASVGVILLDEFDKWMATGRDAQGRDRGRTLQDELLRMIEGEKAWVSDTEELGVEIDTSRILVIACGAFVGLSQIVGRRIGRSAVGPRGFVDPTLWEHVEPADFVSYGMKPELAGRLALHVMLKPLTEEALMAILESPDGLLCEYRLRFEADGNRLVTTEDGLREVARAAMSIGTGARALRFILERVLGEALFASSEGPGHHATLDSSTVRARHAAWEDD